jgi:hypothetical protein
MIYIMILLASYKIPTVYLLNDYLVLDGDAVKI